MKNRIHKKMICSSLFVFLSTGLIACGGSSNGSSSSASNNGGGGDTPAITVEAGANQTVNEQSLATLAGSSSTQGATFLWQQTSGTQVVLSDVTAAAPTFTTPTTANNKVLTFNLTVSLAEQQASDEVSVFITNLVDAPSAPTAEIGESGELIISWGNSAEAASYNLYYEESNVSNLVTGVAGVTEITSVSSPYTLQGLNNYQSHTLAISAVDASANESVLSAAINATPFAVSEAVVCSGDLNQDYNIATIAGSGNDASFSGMGGPATSAKIGSVSGIEVDRLGNLYINVDKRILKLDTTTNIITDVAGTGTSIPNSSSTGGGNGGAATSATFNSLSRITTDADSNFYMASSTVNHHEVRAVNKDSGIISRFAGNGAEGANGDGSLAVNATLSEPQDLIFDSEGHLYIADSSNHVIRKVDASTGNISTFAGVAGIAGTDSTHLNKPVGLAFDVHGNLFVADQGSHTIRKVDVSTGIISIVAGTAGSNSYTGDNGLATSATLSNVSDVMLDSVGNIIIADSGNSVVRLVEATTGNIKTIAGNGTFGFSGDDGNATAAQFYYIPALACMNGKIYTANNLSSRVRVLSPVQ